MTRDDIERVVSDVGYYVHFDDRVSKSGDGTMTTYVQVQTHGAKNRKTRSLGRVEHVCDLSEEALTRLLAEKFKGSM
jgi:hypothetical protein